MLRVVFQKTIPQSLPPLTGIFHYSASCFLTVLVSAATTYVCLFSQESCWLDAPTQALLTSATRRKKIASIAERTKGHVYMNRVTQVWSQTDQKVLWCDLTVIFSKQWSEMYIAAVVVRSLPKTVNVSSCDERWLGCWYWWWCCQ